MEPGDHSSSSGVSPDSETNAAEPVELENGRNLPPALVELLLWLFLLTCNSTKMSGGMQWHKTIKNNKETWRQHAGSPLLLSLSDTTGRISALVCSSLLACRPPFSAAEEAVAAPPSRPRPPRALRGGGRPSESASFSRLLCVTLNGGKHEQESVGRKQTRALFR